MGVCTAHVDGQQIDLKTLRLSANEDSYAWLASITLDSIEAYNLCTPGSALSVTVHGIVWRLRILSRDKSRQWSKQQYSIEARSLSADLHQTPETITYINTTSHAIAAIADCSAIPEWSIDNWTAEQMTGIERCKAVADACGAVLLSRPDGQLIIRPRHLQRVPDYSGSLTLSDDDITNISQSYTVKPGYTRVFAGRSATGTSETQISICELDRDETTDPSYVHVAVGTRPKRPVTLNTSSQQSISITDLGDVNEEITERIQFVDGVASVFGEINQLNSVNWGDNDDLGGVTLSDTGELIAAYRRTSVADVTYVISYRKFRVQFPQYGADLQLIAEAPDPAADVMIDARRGSGDVLAPQQLQHELTTATDPATELARNYLDTEGQGWDVYNIIAPWATNNGAAIMPGDLVTLTDEDNTRTGRITSIDINYTFPKLRISASVEVPRV